MAAESVARADGDEDTCDEEDNEAGKSDVVVPSEATPSGSAVVCSTKNTEADEH